VSTEAEYVAAEARMEERFFTAATGKPPTTEQKNLVTDLREAIIAVATLIEANIPNNRNKALALTALEDVQMRANRAIFDPAKPKRNIFEEPPRFASGGHIDADTSAILPFLATLHKGETIIPGTSLKHQGDTE
jgi:hypothetical protein